MSATVICLSSPADVLSAVPHLLGFHPARSLVLVCLTSHGKGTRLGMVARVDLPGEGQAAEAADALLPAVAREDPDAAILIAYGTAADDGLVAAEVLSAALTEVGVQVRDRLMVVDEGWRSLDWPDGQAWAVIPGPETPAALEFAVAAGSAPVASRAVLARRCAPGPRAVAVGRECARLARTDGTDGTDGEVTVERGAAVWGRLLCDRTDIAGFTDATVALAAVSLHAGGSAALRDALAGWLSPGVLGPARDAPRGAGRAAGVPAAAVVGQPARTGRPRHRSPAGGPAHRSGRVRAGRARRPCPDRPGSHRLAPGQRRDRAYRHRPSPRRGPGLLPGRATGPDGHRGNAPAGDVNPRQTVGPPLTDRLPVPRGHRRGAAASPAVAAEPGRLLRLPGPPASCPAARGTGHEPRAGRPAGIRPGTAAPGTRGGSPRARTGARVPPRSAGR